MKQSAILKFFNDKNFGFLIDQTTGEDVFFHFDDIKDTKLSKDFLKDAKSKLLVKLAYTVQVY